MNSKSARLLKLDTKLAEDEKRISDTVKEIEGVQKTVVQQQSANNSASQTRAQLPLSAIGTSVCF